MDVMIKSKLAMGCWGRGELWGSVKPFTELKFCFGKHGIFNGMLRLRAKGGERST